MPLFQTSVLKRQLKLQDTSVVEKAFKKFNKYFSNPVIQQNIKDSKEEQFQEGFLRELFVNVFEYTINPNPNFNLTTELKNEKGANKADGAIMKDGRAVGVIELKGTKTKDLESIRQQAFDYKANQSACVYVITSNFEKLRFYVNNAVEFEEFDLFNLTLDRFSLMYFCLYQDSLLNHRPLEIKDASVREEENITKKFYSDYSVFKRELFRDLVKQNMKNPVFRTELLHNDQERANKNIKQALFQRSQKLIDRLLFIFFGEDRGLLPPNSTIKILEQWEKLKELDEIVPLYERFKKYFNYLDIGRKGTDKSAEIFAYNGGLFKPDSVLDSLIISDELLHKHAEKLSKYDFDSQIDVNILGHIFENSLNEIESINAEIEGTDFDKQKTKRKKDGVFYTPKYITKYIVDNTLGKLCEEKKIALGFKEEDYLKTRKGRTAKKLQELQELLKAYREWLLTLTILDPACGSGAFLNQALDFLIKEHGYLDEIEASLLGGAIVFPDIENTILEKNIYGVDLNDESVEIAKLSLWLRTAQPRRKLTTLSNNVKCGNSLIDSRAIAGDKAFNWQEQFPEVFENGGFDVVIGNPPYVHLEAVREESEKLSKMHYQTYDKRGDLYCLFVEKAFLLLKSEGLTSYIMPNKWLQAGYGRPLRAFFLTTNFIELIDFGDFQIFEGATTYSCIFIAAKSNPEKTFNVAVLSHEKGRDFYSNLLTSRESFQTKHFTEDTWVISSNRDRSFLNKVIQKNKPLKEVMLKGTFRGILSGLSDAFLIDQQIRDDLILNQPEASNIIHPFLQGRDVSPYISPASNNYLLLLEKGLTYKFNPECTEEEGWLWLESEYPAVANWLKPFEAAARKRTDKGDFWWELRACDYYKEFAKPKIMYQAFQVKPCFVYDESKLFCNNSMWIIPTTNKSLVGVLNSKMGWWLITKFCTQIQNGCQLIWKYFGQIPIPKLSDERLESTTELMLVLKNNELKISSKFSKYLQSQFNLDTLSKKLQNWHDLAFGDFIKELNKAIKKAGGEKLTKSAEMDWMEVFEEKKAEALALKEQIDKTDREIDRLVYQLYELTEEEIAIVEESVKR